MHSLSHNIEKYLGNISLLKISVICSDQGVNEVQIIFSHQIISDIFGGGKVVAETIIVVVEAKIVE